MQDLNEFEETLTLKLIAEGRTDTAISERVGRSPNDIRDYRATQACEAGGEGLVTPEAIAEVVELRLSCARIEKVERITGLSVETIEAIIKAEGLPESVKGMRDHRALDAQVKALYLEGGTVSSIAKTLGRSVDVIRRSLKRSSLWVPAVKKSKSGLGMEALEPALGELVVLPSQPSLEALEGVPDEVVASEVKPSEPVVSSPLEEVVEDTSERCEGTLTPPDGMAKMYLEQIYLGVDYLCASDLDPEKKIEVLHAVIRFCSTGLFSAEASKEVVALLRSGVQQVQGASSFVDDASHYRALIFSQVLKIKENFEDSVYVLHAIIYYCIEKTWGEYRNG